MSTCTLHWQPGWSHKTLGKHKPDCCLLLRKLRHVQTTFQEMESNSQVCYGPASMKDCLGANTNVLLPQHKEVGTIVDGPQTRQGDGLIDCNLLTWFPWLRLQSLNVRIISLVYTGITQLQVPTSLDCGSKKVRVSSQTVFRWCRAVTKWRKD